MKIYLYFEVFASKKDIPVYEIISNMRTLSGTLHSWMYFTSVFWACHISARHSIMFWDSELSKTQLRPPVSLQLGIREQQTVIITAEEWTKSCEDSRLGNWILPGTEYDDSPQRRWDLRSVLKDWIGIDQLRWWVGHQEEGNVKAKFMESGKLKWGEHTGKGWASGHHGQTREGRA